MESFQCVHAQHGRLNANVSTAEVGGQQVSGKSINPHHIIRLTDTLLGYKSQKYIHTDISMHTWILVTFGLGLWANFYWRCGTTSGLSLFALAGFVAGANPNILMKKDCILAMDTVSTGLCLSENWLCLSLPYFTSHWIQIELASYIKDNLRDVIRICMSFWEPFDQ